MIEAGTGQFIAFLDSDDTWEPNKLEECLKMLK
jgi:glycosyltransferase involved in cell wall biosynthesis